MTHTRSMKVAMDEFLQLRQQEEFVEVEGDDSDSKSYQGSGDTVVAAFDPNEEETKVGLKRVGLYEFACLPWHSWAENEFAEQHWLMLKEGEAKGIKVTDSQMKEEFGDPIGTKSYYMVRNTGRIQAANLFWYLDKICILQMTAYMSKEAFAPLYHAEQGVKVSWKDLEESDSKVNFFSMGSELKKSESKDKKITLFPSGVVGSGGKNVPADNSMVKEALKVLENAKQEHKCSDVFEGELQKIRLQLIEGQSDKEKLQQWVDGLKAAVDEQFKDLDEKVAALTTENVMLLNREMWNRATKLWREHMALSTDQFKNWFLCAGEESIKRENEALKAKNERLIVYLQEMRTNCKEIEDNFSKLKVEISIGFLESDRNLALDAELDVKNQADPNFLVEKAMEPMATGDIREQPT
ncbi:hypothetical protein L7F22_056917 [Adiantum nelumboides]|nr:hypothetical protein [Adiantum nelumboides]